MDARETVADEIDLYELLRKIAKYKWFILIFTLVSCITAYIVLSLLPPKYKVEMTVMPNNKEFMNIYLSQLKERAEFKLIHGEVGSSIYTSSMVANLASRDVLQTWADIEKAGRLLGFRHLSRELCLLIKSLYKHLPQFV